MINIVFDRFPSVPPQDLAWTGGFRRHSIRSMKQLFLLRHAKSAWDDPSLGDFDRPLAERGRRASKRIGRFLRDGEYRFESVLCSGAKRARQTWKRVAKELPPDAAGSVSIEEQLYMAGASGLIERLRRCDDRIRSVLLIHGRSHERRRPDRHRGRRAPGR